MEKANKNFNQYMRGSYMAISRKLGCSPKYVSMVLRDKLGKYADRDTDLVKKIKAMALELEEMFKPEIQS